MNLPPAVADNKTILAAIIAIAHAAAERLGIDRAMAIAALARHLEISRPHVYERAARVIDAIELVAAQGPGRPPAPRDRPPVSGDIALTVAVLRHRVEHVDAMVTNPGRTRTVYSPAFRRFILQQHDAWPGDRTLEDFARAVEVPLDTLRDWIDVDRTGLTPPVPPPRPIPPIPVDANQLVREIATTFSTWLGSTRDYIRTMASRMRLLPAQLARVLLLLGMIRPHRPDSDPRRFRHRGQTTTLSPGSMLTTDGKQITIELVGSGKRETRMWQPMVDQATHCTTASVVGCTETSDAVIEAYRESVRFLGGRVPDALLLDNKPCYDAAALAAAIAPTKLIHTTPSRPENNAALEGAYGLFEQHVGALRFDDSSPDALITSAVGEVLRAYVAGADHAARAELGGKSRVAYLREFVPSTEQRDRDRAFLAQLAADHARPRRPRTYPHSRELLDAAFKDDPMLRGKDPRGRLREHLARFHPDAIRLGLAQFRACCQQRQVEERYAHRYLAGVIHNVADELELQRAEAELLDLARQHHQLWTADLEHELAALDGEMAKDVDRLCAIAHHAAMGGLPLEGAFWTGHLLDRLRANPEHANVVRTFLRRDYEAPEERRLLLLDQIAALPYGLN